MKTICEEAEKYQFKSVCVNPFFIPITKHHLRSVLSCTVVGFPLGANTLETKVYETAKAIENGAKEIDMVMNQGLFKGKEYDSVEKEITELAKLCHRHEAILKVIIETCNLTKTEIAIACMLAKRAGADFVKTSTGFAKSGAEAEDVKLMRSVVGTKFGVKASAGIRTKASLIKMLEAGANRIGCSQSTSIMCEKE